MTLVVTTQIIIILVIIIRVVIIIIIMLMPVKQNSVTHLRVLLVLTDESRNYCEARFTFASVATVFQIFLD
jgi:hypothetical protein